MLGISMEKFPMFLGNILEDVEQHLIIFGVPLIFSMCLKAMLYVDFLC